MRTERRMTKPGWRSSAGLDGRGAGCSPLAAAAALPSTHRSAVDRSWQPARSRRLNARGDAGEWRTADRRSPVRYHRPCRRAVHAAGLPHLRRGQGSDERFTSGLGPELADRGITVNALRPGAVRTDLAEASSAPTTTGRAGRHPRRSSPPPPSSPADRDRLHRPHRRRHPVRCQLASARPAAGRCGLTRIPSGRRGCR